MRWINHNILSENNESIKITEYIASGSSSQIYKATNQNGQVYAIKIFNSHDFPDYLKDEIHVLARMNHPYINQVYEVGYIEQYFYMIMEYFEGQTLDCYIEENGPATTEESISIVIKVASALQDVHIKSLVHRDLKPSNILINAEKEIRLLDFGLASKFEKNDQNFNMAGNFLFSSPEQIRVLQRPVDHRSDLYSLGVLFFYCLTQDYPYRSDALKDLLQLHLKGEIPSVCSISSQASQGIDACIEKLLQKDPDDRFQSCSSLILDLMSLPKWEHLNKKEIFPILDKRVYSDQFLDSELIGRKNELRQIDESFELLNSPGKTAAVIVEGDSGSGKSRIVWEFIRTKLDDNNCLFLYGKCQDHTTTLYYVLQKIFGSALQQLNLNDQKSFLEKIEKSKSISHENVYQFDPRFFIQFQDQISSPHQRAAKSIESITEMFFHLFEFFEKIIIFIDDIQWVDDLSLRILNHFLFDFKGCQKIFLVSSSRNEKDSLPSLNKVKSGFSYKLDVSLQIGPLNEKEMSHYISDLLGYKVIDNKIYDWIIQRSRGNPFSVKEYTNALLEKKVIYFKWGKWLVYNNSFSDVDLPDNVIEVVLSRLKKLHPDTISMIAATSLDSADIDVDLLSHLFKKDRNEINDVLTDAIENDVVKKNGSGAYSFSHDRILEASQNLLSDEEKEFIHTEAAAYLFQLSTSEDISFYRMAFHFKNSSSYYSRESFLAHFKAGSFSILNNGYKAARDLLEECLQLLDYAEEREQHNVFKQLGFVYFHTRQRDKSLKYYDLAIESGSFDGLEKAGMCQMKSSACINYFRSKEAFKYAKEAFEYIGFDFSSLIASLLSLKREVPEDKKDETEYVVTNTSICLGRSLYSNFEKKGMVSALLWCYLFRKRHGMIKTRPVFLASLSTLCASIGLVRPTKFFAKKSMGIAKDETTKTAVLHYTSIAYSTLGYPSRSLEMASSNLNEYRRWISPITANDALNTILGYLFYQGYFEKAVGEIDKFCRDHLDEDDSLNLHFLYRKSVTLAMMGLFKESSLLSMKNSDFQEMLDENLVLQSMCLSYKVLLAFASNDLGENIDLIEAEWREKIKQKPQKCLYHSKYYFITVAHARFEICMNQYNQGQIIGDDNLRKLKEAHNDIVLCGNKEFFKVHGLYIQGGISFLEKDYPNCLKILSETKILSEEFDIVWILASCLRLEAHIYEKMNLKVSSQNSLVACFYMIKTYKLGFLDYRLSREFEYFSKSKSTSVTHSRSVTTHNSDDYNDVEKVRIKNYLDALLKISVAASISKNFDETIYNCIDEIINAIGGERGFVVSLSDETSIFHGRDSEKNTLDDMTSVSSTIINKVKRTRLPVLLHNDIEDLPMSESIIAQDLRSIVAVPMLLKDEIIGIIYLDSHAIRGVFDGDDVHILQTAANHVVVAIEARRAADLDIKQREFMKDLEVTGAVQKLLLPRKSEFIYDKCLVKNYFQPAAQSGGDWWWTHNFKNSVLCLIGDVTGHGPGPAMITASIAGAYHAQKYFFEEGNIKKHIPKMMQSFQHCLYEIGQDEYWMSMNALLIDAKESTISYLSAGAPPPILLKSNGGHMILNSPSSPLGSQEFHLNDLKTVSISKGDRIILYTDGAYEIENSGQKMTLGKFKKTILSWDNSLNGQDLYHKMIELIMFHLGEFTQSDDITFVIIEITY